MKRQRPTDVDPEALGQRFDRLTVAFQELERAVTRQLLRRRRRKRVPAA
jgi:hypothetical protein